MSIDISFAQMDGEISLYLRDAYPALFRNTLLQILAIAAAALALGLWLRRRLLAKPAPTHRKSADKKYHYVLAVLLTVLLAFQWLHRGVQGGRLLFILSALCCGAAVYTLLSWRRVGPTLAIAAVWLTLPVKEIPNLVAAKADWADISRFTLPGKIGTFAADQYVCGRAVALALAAGILTVVIIAYYTYRRYLFRENAAEYFTGISACPKCGRILTGEGKFCSACGTKVEGLPRSEFIWEEEEDALYCPNCGAYLRGRDVCISCGFGKKPGEILKDSVKDETKGQIVKYAVLGLIVLLVFVPLFGGNLPGYLAGGSAEISNAFTERLNLWYQDEGVARDDAWLAEFDEANQALFDQNAKGFGVIPDRLSYSGLYVYVQYLDASFYQMAVQQEYAAAVHAGDVSNKSALAADFNATMNLQAQALRSGLTMLLSQNGVLGFLLTLENILTDGIRFNLSFLPLWLRCGLLLAAAGFGLYRWLVLGKKKPVLNPLKTAAAESEDKEALEKMRKASESSRKKDRVYALIAVAILALAVGVGTLRDLKAANHSGEKTYTYQSAAAEAFAEDGVALALWLGDCTGDPEAALAEIDAIKPYLDSCCKALEYLVSAEAPEDVTEENAAAMTVTAAEMKDVLQNIQQAVSAGQLPAREDVSAAAKLLQAGMRLDSSLIYHSTMDQLEDLL